MSLGLLILIQAQEPARLSKAVIVGAILVFIVGVSLLVYFFRRYQKTEKEAQDEWDRPEQSLFGAALPAADRAEGHPPSKAEAGVAAAESEELRKSVAGEARVAPASDLTPLHIESPEPEAGVIAGPTTQVLMSESIPSIPSQQSIQTSPAKGTTGELASPASEIPKQGPDIADTEAQAEATPFDDDVWTGLEMPEGAPPGTQLLGAESPAASIEQAAETSSPGRMVEPSGPGAQTELLGVARVDERPPREPFEAPRITPIVHREPWVPPQIELLKPRVQPPIAQPESPEARTQVLGSSPALTPEQAAPVEAIADAEKLPAEVATPVVAPAAASTVASGRAPAGSVLGLPAERSQAPLVLGAPVKPRDEIGIGALSNYGKDVDNGGGHGGTIALATVILLLGGGIATYLFVPSVNSRVNARVGRARGIDPNPAQPIEQDKAIIFPARNEANKNMVKARGAVDNVSEETLSGLSVEVSLERGNGAPPELRKVAVTPAQLEPKQRGVFEFEYNGNRATGFTGYRIVRLLSGETGIKFTTPGRTG
jgi:hypothetical protein